MAASTESMKAAFACFDTNGDGVLSRDEIRAILQRNDGMSAEDVDEVLDEFDEDGDGKLDLEEFIDFFGDMDDQQVGSTVMAFVNKPVKVANAISKREGRHVAFRTHLLVIAYDYIDSGDYTPEESSGCGPLTCTADAMRLVELARKCGCPDISLMMDKPEMEGGDGWLGWPTAERVKEVFHEIAGRCKPGDTFFFYFSGHGTQSDGRSKNEADGKNEELCLCAPDGSYDPLVDDDLAALIQLLPEGVRCLSVCDCCHSATMADLDSADFGNRRVMHLGASDDSQSAQEYAAASNSHTHACTHPYGFSSAKTGAPRAHPSHHTLDPTRLHPTQPRRRRCAHLGDSRGHRPEGGGAREAAYRRRHLQHVRHAVRRALRAGGPDTCHGQEQKVRARPFCVATVAGEGQRLRRGHAVGRRL